MTDESAKTHTIKPCKLHVNRFPAAPGTPVHSGTIAGPITAAKNMATKSQMLIKSIILLLVGSRRSASFAMSWIMYPAPRVDKPPALLEMIANARYCEELNQRSIVKTRLVDVLLVKRRTAFYGHILRALLEKFGGTVP